MSTALVSIEDDGLLKLEDEIVEVLLGLRFRNAQTDERRALIRYLQSRHIEMYREVYGSLPPVLATRRKNVFIKWARSRRPIKQ